MRTAVAIPGKLSTKLFWAGLAAGAGLVAGVEEPLISSAMLGGAAILIAGAVEPASALAALLIFAPLKALVEAEGAWSLPLDIGQLAFGLALALWVARRIADEHSLHIPLSSAYLPLTAFIGAAALSLWNTTLTVSAASELIKWIEMLVLAAVVSQMTRRPAHAKWLLVGMIAAFGSQAVIGIYEFMGGSGASHLRILESHFRAFGTFGQPNPFGAFMGIGLAMASGAAWGEIAERLAEGEKPRWGLGAFYLSVASLCGVGLIASWSRGAWLASTITSATMALAAPRKRSVGILLVLSLIAGALLILQLGLLPVGVADRLTTFTSEMTINVDVRGADVTTANYSLIERLAHWQASLEMARHHPWLGVGLGNYPIAYPTYALLNWPEPLGHAHNYYLNLLAETGIIGLGTYLGAWAAIFAMTWRALVTNRGFWRGVALGLVGVWSYLTIHNLVDQVYVNNTFMHLGALFGFLATALDSGHRREQGDMSSYGK